MRKLFMSLGLFCTMSFGTALIISCSNEDDCTFDFVNQKPINMQASGKMIFNITSGLDGISRYMVNTYDGTVRDFDILAIEISYDLERIAANQRSASFGNQAYACSPPALANQLVDLTVTADQEYQAGFPAGTSLNGFFVFSFDSIIESGEIDTGALLDGLPLFFKFVNPPSQPGTFNFNFRLEFQDGTIENIPSGPIQIDR